jgi:threonyl-tRNA synthetase
MRVRGFTQDDAHIFCLPSQLSDEILGVLDLTEKILSKFGFDKYVVNLSTRPEKSVGARVRTPSPRAPLPAPLSPSRAPPPTRAPYRSAGTDDIWDKATKALVDALERKGWPYEVDEGGGAFYGPKIDIEINDAIGRTWQCSTIQCDFNLPDRFEMEYVDSEGQRKQPIMVHRAIFGSIERFFGILTENTAGDFPYWLSPVQLRLLPVVGEAEAFCAEVVANAKRLGLRAEVDMSGERLGKLIRNAEMQRVPVMAVVGKSEMESGKLALRTRYGGSLGELPIKEALDVMAKAMRDNVEPHEVLGIEIEQKEQ